MTDSHIHVGQYESIYTSPSDLLKFLDYVQVNYFAASSTTICTGNCQQALNEMLELNSISSGRLKPILWIRPGMLHNRIIEDYIDSDISWSCLKIHCGLDVEEWNNNRNEVLNSITSLASVLSVPLLIHTGESLGCYPSLFQDVIEKRPNVRFILAHGRPIDDSIVLLKKTPNTLVDTAFMPIEHIVKLCSEGLEDRVLWGTDYPIPRHYYPNADMGQYYMSLVEELRQSVSSIQFKKITEMNFSKVF